MAAMLDPMHVQIAAEQWIKAYEKKPKTTVAVTIVAIISLVVVVYMADKSDKAAREAARLKAIDYQAQIKQLDETEKSLKELLSFVESQRTAVRGTEDSISELRKEKARLEPLVASDRATVEAIFRAQEDRASSSIWRERLIGFASGIFASLIATFIWYVGTSLMRRSKSA